MSATRLNTTGQIHHFLELNGMQGPRLPFLNTFDSLSFSNYLLPGHCCQYCGERRRLFIWNLFFPPMLSITQIVRACWIVISKCPIPEAGVWYLLDTQPLVTLLLEITIFHFLLWGLCRLPSCSAMSSCSCPEDVQHGSHYKLGGTVQYSPHKQHMV